MYFQANERNGRFTATRRPWELWSFGGLNGFASVSDLADTLIDDPGTQNLNSRSYSRWFKKGWYLKKIQSFLSQLFHLICQADSPFHRPIASRAQAIVLSRWQVVHGLGIPYFSVISGVMNRKVWAWTKGAWNAFPFNGRHVTSHALAAWASKRPGESGAAPTTISYSAESGIAP